MEKEENIVYKLDILNVDDTPPQEMVIEKHGGVVRFTLAEIEAADKMNRKNLKELTAKRDYELAVCTNIEQNNQYGQEIKDMPEEKRYTVHMYQESHVMAKMCNVKIAELQKAVDDTVVEVADIMKQIPEVASIPSPFVEPGEKVGSGGPLSKSHDNTMLKPVEVDGGKWGIKEVDETGASLGMKEGTFDSEAEAQTAIDGVGEAAPEAETPSEEADESADESADETPAEAEAPSEEATPEGEATPE